MSKSEMSFEYRLAISRVAVYLLCAGVVVTAAGSLLGLSSLDVVGGVTLFLSMALFFAAPLMGDACAAIKVRRIGVADV